MTPASDGLPDDSKLVPRQVEEITPGWLTAVLHAGDTIESSALVSAVEAERIGLGGGYIAELWRLRVSYRPASAGPSSLIAKLPGSPGLAESWWAGHVNEWRFYRQLAASVPLRTPRYFGGVADEAGGIAVTLLEDLGGPTLQDDAGAALPLAEAVVEATATLHAAFWQREPPDWLAADPEQVAAGLASYTRDGTPHLARYAEGDPPVPPGLLELASRLPELVSAASLRLREAPQTLIHGDIRPDNLLAAPGGGRGFAVIDWQGVAWNAGAVDLSYFLGQSLEPGLRGAHEGALLARYLEALAGAGVSGYDEDQLWRDYRLGLVVALFSPVGWSAEIRAAEALVDLEGPAGDSARALLQYGAPLLRALAHRNWRAVEETRALELV
jgi:hypothetical protein